MFFGGHLLLEKAGNYVNYEIMHVKTRLTSGQEAVWVGLLGEVGQAEDGCWVWRKPPGSGEG